MPKARKTVQCTGVSARRGRMKKRQESEWAGKSWRKHGELVHDLRDKSAREADRRSVRHSVKDYRSPRTSQSLATMRMLSYQYGGPIIDTMEARATDWSEPEIERVFSAASTLHGGTTLLPEHRPLMADIATFMRETKDTWRGAPVDWETAVPMPDSPAPPIRLTSRLTQTSFGLSLAERKRLAAALAKEVEAVSTASSRRRETEGQRAARLVRAMKSQRVTEAMLKDFNRKELRIAIGMLTGTEPPLSTKRPDLERTLRGMKYVKIGSDPKWMTPAQERHWETAKKRAEEEGRGGDYRYIMGIWKKMEGRG